jgi:hypothetical protein
MPRSSAAWQYFIATPDSPLCGPYVNKYFVAAHSYS